MTYKTKKLDTLVSHSGELASNMTRGRNSGDINRLSLNSSSEGTTAIVDYKGMIYRVEFIPTYMAVDNTPPPPTLAYVWLNEIDATNEEECINCQHYTYCPSQPDEPECNHCECDNAEECPAAQRRLEDFMDDYNCEHELGGYKPIFGDTGIDKLTIRKDDE